MTHDHGSDLPLGRHVDYPREYDASLLFPIPRAHGRAALGLGDGDELPFTGADRWHAYEVSWLDARGKPVVATLNFSVPADTPRLVESKSLKLYLNSFNGTRFDDAGAVRERIAADLSLAAGGEVTVAEGLPPMAGRGGAEAGFLLDALDIAIDDYGPPNAAHLRAEAYRGPRIDRAGLLRYLVSFRDHAEFHEQCVERIFIDLRARCGVQSLAVEARYTRRGGLDINPWRTTADRTPPQAFRDLRQ